MSASLFRGLESPEARPATAHCVRQAEGRECGPQREICSRRGDLPNKILHWSFGLLKELDVKLLSRVLR